MARDIRFILKEPASGTLTFVYLKFLCSDGYLRYSTDQKISSARDQQGYIHWDEANQRPKFRKIDRQLDDRINEITFRVKEFQKIKNEIKNLKE